jgi:hypothetical protein
LGRSKYSVADNIVVYSTVLTAREDDGNIGTFRLYSLKGTKAHESIGLQCWVRPSLDVNGLESGVIPVEAVSVGWHLPLGVCKIQLSIYAHLPARCRGEKVQRFKR